MPGLDIFISSRTQHAVVVSSILGDLYQFSSQTTKFWVWFKSFSKMASPPDVTTPAKAKTPEEVRTLLNMRSEAGGAL